MKIQLLFFGLARDLAGVSTGVAELADGASVEGARNSALDRFPRLREISGSLLVAVNQRLAAPGEVLRDGDEVAFLPPVSGGESEPLCRITRDVIETAALAELLKTPADGAVAVFEGIARNHSNGRATLYLEYEAFEPMALKEMSAIREEAIRKFPVREVAIVHRTGRIEIGETSVAIVAASAHRAAAFDACRYAIDELKRRVPIWKKEHYAGGAAWAESEAQVKARRVSEPA